MRKLTHLNEKSTRKHYFFDANKGLQCPFSNRDIIHIRLIFLDESWIWNISSWTLRKKRQWMSNENQFLQWKHARLISALSGVIASLRSNQYVFIETADSFHQTVPSWGNKRCCKIEWRAFEGSFELCGLYSVLWVIFSALSHEINLSCVSFEMAELWVRTLFAKTFASHISPRV